MTTTDQIDLARRVAKICGRNSGAAHAVARYDRLRAAGYQTFVRRTKNMWLVKEPEEPTTDCGFPDSGFPMSGSVVQ